MSFFRSNFTLIVTAVLFTILLLLPTYILPSCPKGLSNDSFPGRCPLYADNDQNRVCDLSEVTVADTRAQAPTKSFNFAYSLPVGAFTILLIVATTLLFLSGTANYRYLFLALGLGLGIISFRSVCPIGFLQYLLIFKDKAVLNILLFFLFLVIIILTILFGRVFCGWVCPIGAIEEFIFRLPRWFKIKLPNVTKKVPSWGKYTPLLILVIVGFWTTRSGETVFCKLDPFGYLFGFSTSKVLLGALLVLLAISLFVFRPFCILLCPLGAVFYSLSSISIWRIKRKKEACPECKLCVRKCPVGAIDEDINIDQKQCLRCKECILCCPKNVLSYKVEDITDSEI